ncbi:unnamed protein product [Euphydryas editha]|uniref:Major facilitator superfamily (MFS) profile domain-containing protein n=1 Tax=Euphydryas editha TaxID=104508 RepID=A0AAU9UCR8_EUPED|nr:unnamed protein product [Euphydryas editha]
MMVGFTISWTGPIFLKIRDPVLSPLSYLPTETELSLVASLLYIGGVPGPYVMSWLSNVYGRKPCIIIGGVVCCLAYSVLVWSQNLAMLYCGRLLSGLTIGIIAVMNLVYIGEIASTKIRGILLTIIGIFTTCGSILVFAVGPYFSYKTATSVGLALSVVFTLFSLFIPESPIFHILIDNVDEVKETLKDLGREDDIENLLESKNNFSKTTTKKDWIELITLRSNKRASFIVFTINILQHCSGIFAILAYSGSIFAMAGSSVSPNISMLIIGLFQVTGSVTAPFFVERNGRKMLLFLSCVACFLSMLLLGVYFYLDHISYAGLMNVKWLPLLILIVFFIGYDAGLSVIPNVLGGEMFTMNVRSKGSAVALTCSWISGFLVTIAFGAITENYGIYTAFWFFSCTCFISCLFTLFFVPETKGKSLLEVQEILEKL